MLAILNDQLSHALTSSGSTMDTAQREQWRARAFEIERRYMASDLSRQRQLLQPLTTFALLCKLARFFNLCSENRMEEALQLVESLDILPVDAGSVARCVENFANLASEVRQCFTALLPAAMMALYTLYSSTKSRLAGGTVDALTAERYLQLLRTKNRAIMTFVGMIDYRLPSNISAQLVRLDVMMV